MAKPNINYIHQETHKMTRHMPYTSTSNLLLPLQLTLPKAQCSRQVMRYGERCQDAGESTGPWFFNYRFSQSEMALLLQKDKAPDPWILQRIYKSSISRFCHGLPDSHRVFRWCPLCCGSVDPVKDVTFQPCPVKTCTHLDLLFFPNIFHLPLERYVYITYESWFDA